MSSDPAPSPTASRDATLFDRARQLFPGGVNSPVRAFGSVGGTPRFVTRAEGPYVWDAENERRIDYVSSWGAVILGHAYPVVVDAVRDAAGRGMTYGAPNEGEIGLAERIQRRMPSLERLRFTSSGTEAVMSAVRLVRAHTGRTKIVKFSGCYHGHSDALLAAAGSGVATLGLPGSAGVPPAATGDTIVVSYNDPAAVDEAFERFGSEIAGIVVEPIAANMGLVIPKAGFLEHLRARTLEHDALLVFDEVITGFRVARGGAQEVFGVRPDVTCLGKIVGGGLPVGVFGGREDVMASVAPDGPMYQAGTLSGNPIAMAAGIATLDALDAHDAYTRLAEATDDLVSGIEAAITAAGLDGVVSVASHTGLLTLFWRSRPPRDFAQAEEVDGTAFGRFFHAMLGRGISLPPSPFEAWFVTLAHGDEEIERTIEATTRSLP